MKMELPRGQVIMKTTEGSISSLMQHLSVDWLLSELACSEIQSSITKKHEVQ